MKSIPRHEYHNDPELIQQEIRRLRTSCYPDFEIMRMLNLSHVTYYQHKKRLLLQTKELAKARDIAVVAEDIVLTQSRLEQKVRELQHIIEEKDTKARDKTEAIRVQAEIILQIAKISVETDTILASYNNVSTGGVAEQKEGLEEGGASFSHKKILAEIKDRNSSTNANSSQLTELSNEPIDEDDESNDDDDKEDVGYQVKTDGVSDSSDDNSEVTD